MIQQIKAHYCPGNVFQRDQKYYEQIFPSRLRSRKSNSRSLEHSKHSLYQSLTSSKFAPKNNNEEEELRAQNERLIEEIETVHGMKNSIMSPSKKESRLSKVSKYRISAQNAKILKQEQQILSLTENYNRNKRRIIELQQIRAQIESRMNRIIVVDKNIYAKLDILDKKMNNRSILSAAKEALIRGEDRDTVVCILKSVIG